MIEIKSGGVYRARNGEKIGPMYDLGRDLEWHWSDSSERRPLSGRRWRTDGSYEHWPHINPLDLVAEWVDEPTGPVRTVTRKEIVPGDYGRVHVFGKPENRDYVGVRLIPGLAAGNIADLTAKDLRAAALVFTQLADALESKE